MSETPGRCAPLPALTDAKPFNAANARGTPGKLTVHIHSASDLRAADSNGLSDPFVRVTAGRKRLKTRVLNRTLNPVWDQRLEFFGALEAFLLKPVVLRVWDFDMLSLNDPIGSVTISLDEMREQQSDFTRQLVFDDMELQGAKHGTLSFTVTFELTKQVFANPASPVHASASQALCVGAPADASTTERWRDALLLFLGTHPLFRWAGVIWITSVVAWGGFVALLYLSYIPFFDENYAGAPFVDLGLSKSQLQFWKNVCLQVLTGCFTWQKLITTPWRLSIAAHSVCRLTQRGSGRPRGPGLDWYGRSTDAMWFSIPLKKRALISVLLLCDLAFHFATQGARLGWSSFQASNEMPGTLVINLTFGVSIISGISAGIIQGRAQARLQEADPARFPPDPFKKLLRRKAAAAASEALERTMRAGRLSRAISSKVVTDTVSVAKSTTRSLELSLEQGLDSVERGLGHSRPGSAAKPPVPQLGPEAERRGSASGVPLPPPAAPPPASRV